MTPALRLAFSLLASLVLWVPTIPGAIAADEDPARIALRYLLALIASRFGVGLVFRIVNGYARDLDLDDDDDDEDTLGADEEDEADDIAFGRRRDDVAVAPFLPTEESLLDEALDDVRDTTTLVN